MDQETRHAALPDSELADVGAVKKPDPFNVLLILGAAALLLWVLA